jgi:hypothetical protein
VGDIILGEALASVKTARSALMVEQVKSFRSSRAVRLLQQYIEDASKGYPENMQNIKDRIKHVAMSQKKNNKWYI